jgi:hypothetical protein
MAPAPAALKIHEVPRSTIQPPLNHHLVDRQLAHGARRPRTRLGIRQKPEIRLGKRSGLGAPETNPK